MRKYDQSDEYDAAEARRISAEPWQLALLAMNPEYVSWGPDEDYMISNGQWSSPLRHKSWKEFGPWSLDELNEVVNFYFEISRDSKECAVCGGSGYHPDAQWVSESFYGHSTPFRKQSSRELASIAIMASFGGGQQTRQVSGFPAQEVLARYNSEFARFCSEMVSGDGEWCNQITEDERMALVDACRIKPELSLHAVNAANQSGGSLASDGHHDAINRSILIEARCKRFGIPRTCSECDGCGHVFTSPSAHVNLVLWMIHPRKGCSRGMDVRITESDLPSVYSFLRVAADRNASRFSNIPNA